MKKELSKLEKNIVKGIAIALSLPVVIGIAQGNSKTVGEIMEEEKAAAPTSGEVRLPKAVGSPKAAAGAARQPSAVGSPEAIAKVQEFNVSALPEYCRPAFQRLSMQTYELCVHEGMTHYQIATVIGVNGEPKASSGNVEIFGWDGIWTNGYAIQEGYMSATFSNGRMVSKAQYGLPSDPDLY